MSDHRETALLTMQPTEHWLQTALDVASMGAWGWDETTQTKLWPKQTKAIFGLAPEIEMTRELFVSMLHPDDAPRYHAAWAAAMTSRRLARIRTHLSHPPGERRRRTLDQLQRARLV